MYLLEAAVYKRTVAWSALVLHGSNAVADRLGALLGRQIEISLGDIPAQSVGLNMVVSTMLDVPFTSQWLRWPAIASAARKHTRSAPQNIVTAYECASWGYVLRYAKNCAPTAPYIVISILDLNIFGLSYWRNNSMWGDSGFGLTTIVLRCSQDDFIHCQTSKSANAFGEFCVDLRTVMTVKKDLRVCAPYFPPNIATLYDRLLPSERLLTNRNADYGHSFGSDPWIALIEHRQRGLDGPSDHYLATSIALSGYWCFAEVEIADAGRFIISEAESEDELVEAAA